MFYWLVGYTSSSKRMFELNQSALVWWLENIGIKCLRKMKHDISLNTAFQFIQNSAHIDRRSMPAMGYMTHTVSAPSLHGKSVSIISIDSFLSLLSIS